MNVEKAVCDEPRIVGIQLRVKEYHLQTNMSDVSGLRKVIGARDQSP